MAKPSEVMRGNGKRNKSGGHAVERFLLRILVAVLNRKDGAVAPVSPDDLAIIPFSGYGSESGLHFRGRVVEKSGVVRMERGDVFLHNARKMWKRFFSRPAAGVTVNVGTASVNQRVTTTRQGFFRVDWKIDRPPPKEGLRMICLRVVSPRARIAVSAVGPVFIPSRNARIGIISDIDDTILHAHATNPFKMLRLLMFSNASTRMPFPGVISFYRALQEGRTGGEKNPFFYISSGCWQLYDLLLDFMEIHGLPPGPIFLRELPLSRSIKDPWRHGRKFMRIREILEAYPSIPFVLIGDSGQRDAETYSLIVRAYPGRIAAVYIRDVLPTKPRRTRIAQLAAGVKEIGSEMVLVEDTMTAALHAASRGWISERHLADVKMDRRSASAWMNVEGGHETDTFYPSQDSAFVLIAPSKERV